LRVVLIATVLLIAAQFVVLAHGSHDLLADDERSTCLVCVLGHNMGGAIPPVASVPPVALAHVRPELPSQFAFSAPITTGYEARGPPSRDRLS
jgi:hypothetical protein